MLNIQEEVGGENGVYFTTILLFEVLQVIIVLIWLGVFIRVVCVAEAESGDCVGIGWECADERRR